MAIVRNTGTGRGLILVDLKGVVQVFNDGEGNPKHGALVISHPDKRKEVLVSNSAITGHLIDLDVHNHELPSGEVISSLRMRLQDDQRVDPDVLLSVSLNSYIGAKVAGLLNAADLSLPITIAANTVMAGEKFFDKVAQKDNVFVTVRQGSDGHRLKEIWANGVDKLPDCPPIMHNGAPLKQGGKVLTDKTALNALTVETIKGIYVKLDALRDGAATPSDGDDGLSPADVAAAANDAAAHPPQRARG